MYKRLLPLSIVSLIPAFTSYVPKGYEMRELYSHNKSKKFCNLCFKVPDENYYIRQEDDEFIFEDYLLKIVSIDTLLEYEVNIPFVIKHARTIYGEILNSRQNTFERYLHKLLDKLRWEKERNEYLLKFKEESNKEELKKKIDDPYCEIEKYFGLKVLREYTPIEECRECGKKEKKSGNIDYDIIL